MAGPIYTVREVQAATGVEPRTLRHWIREGLVPKPLGHGPAARYTDEHIVRVRVVQHLRAKKRPLHAIKKQFTGLSREQIAALAPPPARPTTPRDVPPPPPARPTTPDGVPLPPPAPSYPYLKFQYVALMPGLGLLVADDGSELLRRIANEIHRHYAMPAAPSTLR